VATAQVSAATLATPLPQVGSEPEALEEFRGALEMRLAREHEVCVLAGPRVHRRRCEALVAGLAELPGVRVASQTGSKAVLDEEHPASLGTYMGATTHSGAARDAVDHATLLVMAGTVESDFTTGFFTHRYDSAAAVELAVDHARIGRAVYPGVRLEDALRVLGELVTACDFAPVTPVDLVPPARPEPGHGEEPLDQARFWAAVGEWLAPCTLVVAEAGTSFYGALDLRLPRESDLLGSPVWSAIGFTLPATLGAGLARPEHRPVLFIGDGSAQLTIAELGTIYARGLRPVIFLLNNAGYTVERAIQSPDAVYQDIVAWDWTAIPAALGAPDVATFTVRTSDDLAVALDAARDPSVATFVEVVLPPYDAPRLLVELAKGVQATNTSTE
jgi:TPP-dependent 2-oxoacid decarboxylase